MENPFTQHPKEVGETYLLHASKAFGFSFRLFSAGLACMCHALLPFTFKCTASQIVSCLHAKMVASRKKPSA